MMALNSELQFSQGTIGALKTSVKDVRIHVYYMCIIVSVKVLYNATCTCTCTCT